MEVKIVNIVVTVHLNTELDLKMLKDTLENLGQVVYKPERFPGLILKMEGNISMLIFRTGNIVVAGAKTLEEVKNVVKNFINHIKDRVSNIPTSIKIQVQNIVATADLGRSINLEELSRRLPNVLYEPEQFPGLIYRPNLGKPVALIFSTGKVVLVGSRDEKELIEAYEELKKIVASAPSIPIEETV